MRCFRRRRSWHACGDSHCVAGVQRKLFHLMGWLDAQLFRRAAAMRYGGASDSAGPYTDPGKDHWRKVVVSWHCAACPSMSCKLKEEQCWVLGVSCRLPVG